MPALRDDNGIRSALDIARMVRDGTATPSAITAECLARIDATQATLNAYVTVCHAEAMRDAKALNAAATSQPLLGVPVSVKDNIETVGVRTTFGSKTRAANMPATEGVAVKRLRAAGAVMVGKTTLPEFASSLLGESPLTGSTRNPWNLALSPGGSSSGAAAAVAAGLGPIALTTDAGASTRLPAALCGVLGIKPSMGLIPYELFPDGFGNFIHMGLMTRTVGDMAAALDVVSGADASDPLSIGVAPTRALAKLAEPLALGKSRIAWRPLLGNAALDDEVRALCERTLEVFKDRGATVDTVIEPFEGAGPTWRVLQQVNWAGRFAVPDEATAAMMDPGFVAGIRAGAAISGNELNAAIYKRTSYFRMVQTWFQSFDWLATPVTTVSSVAADAKGDAPLTINGQPVGELRAVLAPYLNVFNLTGHPAISVPAGFTKAGVPVGIQLVGRLYADTDLLRMAKLIEDIQPWASRIPAAAPH
ncbi:MAG: amidase [Betaproteobacteria bacterium]|nr:amidase [Betaproteobacteria bacterium]